MRIPFAALPNADLVPGDVYEGGAAAHLGSDPLARLLPIGNQGGIRGCGPIANPALLVLKTNWSEPEWPDFFDRDTRVLEYFGDNRRPGNPLHKPRGNRYLETQFQRLHQAITPRRGCAPTLVFDAVGNRNVRFIGLAAPGGTGFSARDDLVAFWTYAKEGTCLNYRAIFTVLPDEPVKRSWIESLTTDLDPSTSPDCPMAFRRWVKTGFYS